MTTLLLPDPLADAAEQRARLHGRLDAARDRLACVVSAFLDALEDHSEAVRAHAFGCIREASVAEQAAYDAWAATLADTAEVRL